MSIGPREHKRHRSALFLGNSVQTKRRQLFGRRRRQHQRQHDARRARQQAGRAIKARPQPGERRVESRILELPVPATEGQRPCRRVAGAFDEAEERLEPGNEIGACRHQKKQARPAASSRGNGAWKCATAASVLRPGPGLYCPPGQLATITSMPSQFVHPTIPAARAATARTARRSAAPHQNTPSTTATIGCSKRARRPPPPARRASAGGPGGSTAKPTRSAST